MTTESSDSSSTRPDHESDAVADPASSDTEGHDWSSEGGATPHGPATSAEPGEANGGTT